mmetsp:Transcript_99126/g.180890  ORF Transcript_99126/g.180890 Transcript_99126/m.180890 type:complete len:83 (-) Transcript_99126:873-1121(-)
MVSCPALAARLSTPNPRRPRRSWRARPAEVSKREWCDLSEPHVMLTQVRTLAQFIHTVAYMSSPGGTGNHHLSYRLTCFGDG